MELLSINFVNHIALHQGEYGTRSVLFPCQQQMGAVGEGGGGTFFLPAKYTQRSHTFEPCNTGLDPVVQCWTPRADYLTKSNSDRGLRQQMNLYICLHVGYLQEMNVVVVCATCLLDIYYGKEGLHIWVC